MATVLGDGAAPVPPTNRPGPNCIARCSTKAVPPALLAAAGLADRAACAASSVDALGRHGGRHPDRLRCGVAGEYPMGVHRHPAVRSPVHRPRANSCMPHRWRMRSTRRRSGIRSKWSRLSSSTWRSGSRSGSTSLFRCRTCRQRVTYWSAVVCYPVARGARAQFMFERAGGERITLYIGSLGPGRRCLAGPVRPLSASRRTARCRVSIGSIAALATR